ncbi:helix-turn-helix domain-containing protein [Dyadobacter subterraneus]|uniref:Helix-turn-helix transcriptional regulator n=1 Tax=Dyadobacter subterraneus TaxID=2773304 RepID=A0ABR9W855_9BACT|nr:AraC family transcriptional regulator [Dyadobacter subterraneus]MBE9461652.1 helix-turn-helix transcriptional regulator [Dyadobacter subterraneus]
MENAPYPCHVEPTISNEQFIAEHIFIYLETGFLTIYDGNETYTFGAGEYGFISRNHFARYKKGGANGKEFKSVSIFVGQEFLRSFSKEYGYEADPNECFGCDAVIKLDPHTLLESYLKSIKPYMDLTGKERDHFMFLKTKEIVLLLLKTNPELKNVLLDFSDPGKIDLENFMNRNFRFNVSLKRFSYLAGRSLTVFKEDFKKTFGTSPGRWLQEKRLTEAHFRLEHLGQHPSEVYLEVGFEDLSHFSYAFKKKYGIAPSHLKKSIS